MKIRLWGTRGSIPVSSPRMDRYGGDTLCVEIVNDAGERLILDAGTGIHALGERMAREKPGKCAICFTHAHWDHILGLTHFAPLFNAGWEITLHGPRQEDGRPFSLNLREIFDQRHFPVSWDALPNHPVVEFAPGDEFNVGGMLVKTCPTSHPGACVAYRVQADGWSFVFTGDHECGNNPQEPRTAHLLGFMAGAGAALVDGHYFLRDYETHKGWGHSAMEQWPPLLAPLGIGRLVYAHYAPSYTDDELEKGYHAILESSRELPVSIDLGRQGMILSQNGVEADSACRDSALAGSRIFEFLHRISQYSELNQVLDTILNEGRQLTGADAGTIYLVRDDRLEFSYTANDTLFPGSEANRHIYLKATLPMDTSSIAGFVASTGRCLNIPDVYDITAAEPYTFNKGFDSKTGYRTSSMLTVPFLDASNKPLGVLQLINSKDDGGRVRPFTSAMEQIARQLAILAVNALERANMANDMIMRMNRTAELRDPKETGAHVHRVGAMAAEIYHHWAEVNHIALDKIRIQKNNIRLAAMLHDVGKVGIPDSILKKPGRLTPEERAVMETHTFLGAQLFSDARQGVDELARIIALNHHQKWDGTGYTGSEAYPRLSGRDIPLEARITAVADVFDALVSRRSYKGPMPESEAIAELERCAGTHFDPEIVKCFVEIKDVIMAIIRRYTEPEQ